MRSTPLVQGHATPAVASEGWVIVVGYVPAALTKAHIFLHCCYVESRPALASSFFSPVCSDSGLLRICCSPRLDAL